MQLAQFGLQGCWCFSQGSDVHAVHVHNSCLTAGGLVPLTQLHFPTFALLLASFQARVLWAPTAYVPQAQMLIKSLGKGHSVHKKARFNLYNLQSSFSKQWARSIFCILNFSISVCYQNISVYSFTLTAKLLPGIEINYQHLHIHIEVSMLVLDKGLSLITPPSVAAFLKSLRDLETPVKFALSPFFNKWSPTKQSVSSVRIAGGGPQRECSQISSGSTTGNTQGKSLQT